MNVQGDVRVWTFQSLHSKYAFGVCLEYDFSCWERCVLASPPHESVMSHQPLYIPPELLSTEYLWWSPSSFPWRNFSWGPSRHSEVVGVKIHSTPWKGQSHLRKVLSVVRSRHLLLSGECPTICRPKGRQPRKDQEAVEVCVDTGLESTGQCRTKKFDLCWCWA